jgi:transposase-like protein
MSKRRRRTNFTAEQKVAIVREHLLEGVAVSDLCDRHGLQPSQFYRWQKRLFEQGAKALDRTPNGRERELGRKVEKLEARLKEKDEVIAEVTQELVFLKKGNGGA